MVFFGGFSVSALNTATADIQAISATMVEGDVDPVSSSSCIDLKSDKLRYRATDVITNGEVSVLQDFLSSVNLLKSSPTGYFGLGTLAAVKQFQTLAGLSSTGYAGALTKAKIKDITCNGAAFKGYVQQMGSTDTVGQAASSQSYVIGSASGTRPIRCTMEARFCSDGTAMLRDPNTCAWIESSCKTTIPPVSVTGQTAMPSIRPIACTMEARLCPDGTMMARDMNTCAWITSSCNATTTKVLPSVYYGYDPLPPVKPSVRCSMDARFCADGTMMLRDANTCAWIESSCKTTIPPVSVTGQTTLPATTVLPAVRSIRCTMEARLCSDGTAMLRDPNTCAWIESSCKTTIPPVNPTTSSPIQCSTDPFSGLRFCGPGPMVPAI